MSESPSLKTSPVLAAFLLGILIVAGSGANIETVMTQTPNYTLQDFIGNQKQSDDVYQPEHGLGGFQRRTTAGFPGQLKSNASTVADGLGMPPFKVETNKRGLRDEKISPDSNQSGVKVAIVGGSITFGMGVNESQRYTEMLETNLSDQNLEYEFYNMGLPGLGMKDFYRVLDSNVERVNPDVIVVAVSGGDFLTQDRAISIHEEALSELSLPEDISDAEAKRIKKQSKIEAQREVSERWVKNESRMEELLIKPMNRIVNVAQQQDSRLIFYKTAPTRDRVNDTIWEWAEKNNVKVGEPSESYLNNIRSTEYSISEVNHHPNRKGHSALAEGLADYVGTRERK